MRRTVYMRIVTTVLLMLYVAVGLHDAIAAITCDCHDHHICCTEQCEHCTMERIGSLCDCHHDHSTSVELYVDFRASDDVTLRFAMQPAMLGGVVSSIDEWAEWCVMCEYQVYLLPPLLSAASSSALFRAPPVLA